MGVTIAPARIAEFREAVAAGAIAADGAMGTMLVARGAFRRRCLDELNLSLPALVRDVHQEYLRAGAQILKTNTFGANRRRLEAFGFGDKVRAINQAGVRIAREAARPLNGEAHAFVAGSVGPMGVALEPLGATRLTEARAIFGEQMRALVESGVDLLVLETFSNLGELHQAILAAREAAGSEMVVAAHVTVEDDGRMACGASLDEVARRLEEWPADVIGVNCSAGPKAVLEAMEALAARTAKPLSAMPNAGIPAQVNGRLVYPCLPEYLAQIAGGLLRAGVRVVGGCCGTTPEHIRAIRRVVNEAVNEAPAIAATRSAAMFEGATVPARALEKIPVAERSRLGSKLAMGQFVTMVELPPHGADAAKAIETAMRYKDTGVDCVAIADAPGAMNAGALAQLIQDRAEMECLVRVSVQERDALTWQTHLLGLNALGIRNVLCAGESTAPVAVASNLNQGLDVGGHGIDSQTSGSQTSLVAGVMVNPHAFDLDEELRQLEQKVGAGADFAVTPVVFDLDLLEMFLNRIEPLHVPLIASVRLLQGRRDVEFLIHEMRTPVPGAYAARMIEGQSEEAMREEGIAIAREMMERLHGMVAGIQLIAAAGCHEAALEAVKEITSRQ